MKLLKMFGALYPSYSPLPREEKNDDSSSSSSEFGDSPTQNLLGPNYGKFKSRYLTRKAVSGIVITAVLSTYIAVFCIGLALRPKFDLDRTCLEHTSAYC